MKNFTRLFIFVLALTTMAVSYSFAAKRMVLIEEGTNASCGPCAGANPTFQTFVEKHLDQIIPVTIHSSWPGATDPMYLDDVTMSKARVVTYYGIQGVPSSFVNGLPSGGIFPSSTGLILQEMANYQDESPITLGITETKTGTNVNVKIDVSSTESLVGKKLRVYAVEYSHHYENAGNNGEKDFKWIAKKMLPDYKGTLLMQEANEAKSFEFSYVMKTTWNADEMYIVAFIQDDDTKEVLQAATDARIISPILSFDNIFTKIPRSGQQTSPVTIKNNGDVKATFNLTIDQTGVKMPAGWTATVAPASVTLEAGASTDVNVTVNSADKAAFAATAIKATPKAVAGHFLVNSIEYLYSLTNDAKYVIYADWNPFAGGVYSSLGSNLPKKYADDMVQLNNSVPEVMAAYPPTDFEAAIFSARTQYLDNRYIYPINDGQAAYISQMINAGKDVFVLTECSAGLSDQLPGFKSFMNRLGVSVSEPVKQRATMKNDGTGGVEVMTPFTVTGVTGDSVGNGINLSCNQAYPYFEWWTDVLSINSGSISKPIFYYDNNKNSIAGVRAQIGESKIVYLTFGLSASSSQENNIKVFKSVMDWFTNAAPAKMGPVFTLSNTTVNFDEVKIGENKDFDVTITNTGDEALQITEVYKESGFDADNVFSIIKGNTGLPITIQPNQGSHVITVRFTPKDKKLYDDGFLTIKSNDEGHKEVGISLNGTGIEGASVYENNTSSNGLLSLSAGPNPFASSTKINVTVGGSTARNIELSVIDAAGRTVAFIANETMTPGQYVKDFNADGGLASGTYFILAVTDGAAVRIPVVLNK